MTSARTTAGIAVLAALVLAVACARLPTTRYYVLDPPAASTPATDGAAAARGAGLRVGVERFRVDPPYDQDRLVYRVGEASPEVAFYAYHRWAAPLARMLPPLVAAAFDGVRGLASVEPSHPGGSYDARLVGRLLALEEIDTPSGEQARLRLELQLVDGTGDVLWSDVREARRAGRADDPLQIVELMRQALEQALAASRGSLERRLAAGR